MLCLKSIYYYTLFIDNCQGVEYNLQYNQSFVFSGEETVISYEPFYKTMANKNMTTYKLIKQYGVSRSLIDRLKHNKPISTVTLDDLCKYLDCRVEDIIVYIKE